ncbi:MAG: hypothetical protein HXY34_05370 [Candidatus Thorarchaeota archaeon]|nr:hypothetical protein [Candidatus Thorarchaeota archaeon]
MEDQTCLEQQTSPAMMLHAMVSRLRVSLIALQQRNGRNGFLLLCAIVVTLSSSAHYLLTMMKWTAPGFALDDSWIHLNYARTIYDGIPFEYSPGYPSTGSTSPLWSLILSALFLVTYDPSAIVVGTLAIATSFYCATSLLVGLIVYEHTRRTLFASLSILTYVLVPKNTWLMLSGMETPLFMTTVLLGLLLLHKNEPKYDIPLGVVLGLAYLSRPEGVLLMVLFPLRVIAVFKTRQLSTRRLVTLLAIPFLALAVAAPWILHCLHVTGLPLPDTVYAKAHVVMPAEYELWASWWLFWFCTMPFLILGFISGPALVIKGRPHVWLYAILLFILYALTTPFHALINNSRYLVPIFTLMMVSAVIALTLAVGRLWKHAAYNRERDAVVVAMTVLLLIVPILPEYSFQADLYGNSVKNINEQQVHIGYWLKDNTPADAVLAIHDAGALRFISGRSVIDLAGLVSPDILHGNMTDDQKIRYLRDHGCDYFVFFDELFQYWAYRLEGGYEKLYTVHLTDNVISGRDTMSVWHIDWDLTAYRGT